MTNYCNSHILYTITFPAALVKVRIRGLGILHIWNLRMLMRKIVIYILSAENVIFKDLLTVKVNGSDVNPGICRGFHKDSFLVDVISVNFNSIKVYEDEFFGCQDMLQFLSWVSEDFKYVKSPNLIATVTNEIFFSLALIIHAVWIDVFTYGYSFKF